MKRAHGRVHVSLQLDIQLLKQAEHIAIDLNITRSELINRALAMFLNGCERVLPVKTGRDPALKAAGR